MNVLVFVFLEKSDEDPRAHGKSFFFCTGAETLPAEVENEGRECEVRFAGGGDVEGMSLGHAPPLWPCVCVQKVFRRPCGMSLVQTDSP